MNPSLKNTSVLEIGVSYDGTWQRRGHHSLLGIELAIDFVTGLVVDIQVLSKYCHMCALAACELDINSSEFSIWQEEHKSRNECEQNFSGSSGSMEVHAAELIWLRSIKLNSLKYTTILSDGNAATWSKLKEVSKYPVEKEKCLNHVAKRL